LTAENDKKSLRGFAGLSAMTSDVNAAIAIAESIRRQGKGQAGWPDTKLVHKASGAIERRLWVHTVTKLMIFTVSVVMFTWALGFVGNLLSRSPSPVNTPDAGTTAAYYPPQVSEPAAAPTAKVRAEPLPFDTHGLPVELPPTGIHHVLSRSQLRYCQILKIRIGMGETIEKMSSDKAVKLFNEDVDANNSRCINYYYRRSDAQITTTEVESHRLAFATDAFHDFTGRAAIDFSDLEKSNHKGSKGR
jgi:hypothetical protein